MVVKEMEDGGTINAGTSISIQAMIPLISFTLIASGTILGG